MASEDLRNELKLWEKNFQADNGRKPGRNDIRNNCDIAAKYKRFNALREPQKRTTTEASPKQVQTPTKASRRTDVFEEPLRERAPNAVSTTPRKACQNTNSLKPFICSPVKEEQPTPAHIRSQLGPTPQKDGQVLGIFDMLPGNTPSKPSASPGTHNAEVVNATPSKPSNALSSESAISRTPQSSGKRHYLDGFMGTPLSKRKRDADDIGSPSSSKRLDATPAFLRRSFILAPIEEDHDDDAVAMLPPMRPRRTLARTLSSMIRGLKKDVETNMDDDWDIMNELEAEERGEAPRPTKKPDVLVQDSQVADMPLGPDQAPPDSDDDEPEPLGADGLPRKVWKKKGLKRQTKKHNMKPVLNKPKKAADLEQENDDDDDFVAESQLVSGAAPQLDTAKNAGGSYSEFEDDERLGLAREKKQASSKKTSKTSKEDANGEDGLVKKVIKKVSATANANFRRLNIKNKNSKAKGRGRFGRR